MPITREVFLRRGTSLIFEVGYRAPDNGCDYVFVPGPDGGHLEYIYGHEIPFDRDEAERVETRPDVWYYVDGDTIFAKEIGPYIQDKPDSPTTNPSA